MVDKIVVKYLVAANKKSSLSPAYKKLDMPISKYASPHDVVYEKLLYTFGHLDNSLFWLNKNSIFLGSDKINIFFVFR